MRCRQRTHKLSTSTQRWPEHNLYTLFYQNSRDQNLLFWCLLSNKEIKSHLDHVLSLKRRFLLCQRCTIYTINDFTYLCTSFKTKNHLRAAAKWPRTEHSFYSFLNLTCRPQCAFSIFASLNNFPSFCVSQMRRGKKYLEGYFIRAERVYFGMEVLQGSQL